MEVLTVRDISVDGRKVLLRADLNVPISDKGGIGDDSRIKAVLPTLQYLREHQARVLVVSHLGRPKGQTVSRYSLRPISERLSQLLDAPVNLLTGSVEDALVEFTHQTEPSEVALLENIRFQPGERKNDPALARQLASAVDIYVNDAFGAAHRAHASTCAVAEFLPAVGGFLMEEELRALGGLRVSPERPYAAVLGGAKISDKLSICRGLLDKVDSMMLGGGLANTFLKCLGHSVGNSLVEEDMIPEVQSLIAESKRQDVDLLMPLDVITARSISPDAPTRATSSSEVGEGWTIVDIGPRTVQRYLKALKSAETVFWNGPMGIFEIAKFARGTERIAKGIAELDSTQTVVGGGESSEALSKLGLTSRINHVSTGGGASLQFLAGEQLPAVEVLQKKAPERGIWIGGKWKMNKSAESARQLAGELADGWQDNDMEVVVFPPHPLLSEVEKELSGSTALHLGGQDCHFEQRGAYTGGISGRALRSVGAEYVIIGHSERRRYDGEDDELINRKVHAAWDAGLSVVLCVGEELSDREEGRAHERTAEQLRVALQDCESRLSSPEESRIWLIVAYEPVWAIGTGEAASEEDVQDMCSHLREELCNLLDDRSAELVRIVYGGSVKAHNVRKFLRLPDVDGALVGGASLQAESFLDLLSEAGRLDEVDSV